MKQFSNTYIFCFTVVMVIVVAAVLAFTSMTLSPKQQKNVQIETKRNILASLGVTATPKDAEAKFDEYIQKSIVVDASGNQIQGVSVESIIMKEEMAKPASERQLPVYVATKDGQSFTIFPLAGVGLWGDIWGYITLKSDLSTVEGVNFSHASETPGLGAEITSVGFQQRFLGKRVFNDSGEFVSVSVKKAGSYVADDYTIDALSGSTLTSRGLHNMLMDCLSAYLPYIENNKTK